MPVDTLASGQVETEACMQIAGIVKPMATPGRQARNEDIFRTVVHQLLSVASRSSALLDRSDVLTPSLR